MYEAPVALTYGMGNRASAIRIPKYVSNQDEVRIEYRPPDSTANPYLCLTAILLAGIDGVLKKVDPVKEGYGPFDGIVITAATERIPEVLLNQLKIGGRLVAPVGGSDSQVMTLAVRTGENEFEYSPHGYFVFVPMLKGTANGI